jgi:PKD repeat protein
VATLQGSGRLLITWTGTAATLPDSTVLAGATFAYNGGSSQVAFYDNGGSCSYATGPSAPALYDSPQAEFYVNGFVGPSLLAADFSVSNRYPLVHQAITLTDLSTGSPTAWKWTISPPNAVFVGGTTSTSQNPQVKFTTNGIYSITLKVYKGTQVAVRVRTSYIYAGTPGLWTGITGTDWQTASNWHNFIVPATTVGVEIPTSAPNWPLLPGDLSIGGLCNGVTMTGNAQVTVEGDLIIQPGKSLVFTGAGQLHLGGDWDNQGTFSCGTGNIRFTGGTGSATIIDHGTTETFYKITVEKPVILEGTVVVTGL